ncbi:hypothetical protein MXB_2023 [Myxobolus squamalis]|nr:hypothetical protein MXB_2023 [Myxobolus squamalis]
MDAISWINLTDHIFDATNTTIERRKKLYNLLTKNAITPFYVESICNDEEIVKNTLENIKINSLDYVGMSIEEGKIDFLARIKHYQDVYIPINKTGNESHYSFFKIFNAGVKYEVNCCQDSLKLRIINFLMHNSIGPKTIYISRVLYIFDSIQHGESEFNVDQKIGGNPPLTSSGTEYAKKLANFFKNHNFEDMIVFTSVLQRTIKTSQFLANKKITTPSLNEINAVL